MFIDKRATPPTETPTSAHRPSWEREREREPESLKLFLISRSGALPRSGRVTTRRGPTLIRGTLPSPPPLESSRGKAVRMKGKRSGLALWRKKRIGGTGALQKEQIDLIAHTGDGVCSAGTVGIDWQIGGQKRGKKRQPIHDWGVQLNSLGWTFLLENCVSVWEQV